MPYKFGHKVTIKDGDAVYADDGEFICELGENLYGEPSTRECPVCRRLPTEKGHDPCLKDLSFVIGACCGHGVHEGYVRFDDGTVKKGDFSNPNKP